MKELKERVTENGIDYILIGDYYFPDLKLPQEKRPIGRYGRLHRDYLKRMNNIRSRAEKIIKSERIYIGLRHGATSRMNGWSFQSSLRSNTARIMAAAISCWPGDVLSHSSVNSPILLTSLSFSGSRSR